MNAVNSAQKSIIHMGKQAGFTLIEIMVVVIIIGVLTALIAPNIIGQSDKARITAAKADIHTIAMQLDLYKLDNFFYPSTDQGLQALVTKPSGTPEPKNWKSDGYLPRLPMDPWLNPYTYVSPGAHGTYDLSSPGPDGQSGNEDDVNNWAK